MKDIKNKVLQIINNKNFKRIAIVVILFALIFGFYKSISNSNKDLILVNNRIDRRQFQIYKQKTDGSGYELYTGSGFPEGQVLNVNRTVCLDNNGNELQNVISYRDGRVSVSSNKTVFCTLYFDIVKPDITVVITGFNETHNTKSVSCTTGETPQSGTTNAYFNTKYQALVFNNVTSKNTNCTLTSTNTDLSSTKTTLRDTITGLITSGNIYEHQTAGVTDWALENVADSGTNSNGDTVTVGYRYEGKKPNNYIWFNNEMWRIIGVIPTCTASGCTTKEDLVKIIRAESIGGLKWHTSTPTYVWSDQYSLYQVLNSYYLTKSNATGDAICTGTVAADCDYRVKGIGETSYYGNMIKNVYWNSGKAAPGSTAAATYGNEMLTQDVGGKIGIMNASDYGYATTTHTASLSSYKSYTGTNWLFSQGFEWMIDPFFSDGRYALFVENTGNMNYNVTATLRGFSVRPVAYLDSSVYVISGDGSEGTPYQIAM